MENHRFSRVTQTESQSILSEHSALAGIISEICEQSRLLLNHKAERQTCEVARISDLLRQLSEMSKLHFEHEEQIMMAMDYPSLKLHKRDHEHLLECLYDFTCQLEIGKIKLSNDFGANLQSWLNFHIRKYDDVYMALIRHLGNSNLGANEGTLAQGHASSDLKDP